MKQHASNTLRSALFTITDRENIGQWHRQHLHAWDTGSQAKAAIGQWVIFYNHRRPHTVHGGQPPAVIYFNSVETDQQAQVVA